MNSPPLDTAYDPPDEEVYWTVLLTGEFKKIAAIASILPGPSDGQEIWIGDDAAVLRNHPDGWLLLTADSVVSGIHADLSLTGLDDLGWRAMAGAVSDIAAMGGRPAHAMVTVAGPADTDLLTLYSGLADAAEQYRCPIVGGDLTNAGSLVVTVAVIGHCDGPPVSRAGAKPGDAIWVTGVLGAAAAGLRMYQARAAARLDDPPPFELPNLAEFPDLAEFPNLAEWANLDGDQRAALLRAHARPRARIQAGEAARKAGATAMIDVSDGLTADLGHIAHRSGVGLRLDVVPVAPGATVEDAIGGGDDLVLAFCAPDSAPVGEMFSGLDPPIRIGWCTGNLDERTLATGRFNETGWEHSWED